MRLSSMWRFMHIVEAKVNNIHQDLRNSSHTEKAEFNYVYCFIIHSK